MYKKIFGLLVLLLLFSTGLVFAETTVADQSEIDKLTYGIEIDALPYITGGSYFSSWVGREKYRLRLVLSEVNIPEFITPDGFEDWNSNAKAIIVDYFWNLKEQAYSGPWVGLGLEHWDNKIKAESGWEKASFEQDMFTFGTGYVHYFTKNCYINPWVAGHLRLNGVSKIKVGSKTFDNKSFQYEASVKFGWKF